MKSKRTLKNTSFNEAEAAELLALWKESGLEYSDFSKACIRTVVALCYTSKLPVNIILSLTDSPDKDAFDAFFNRFFVTHGYTEDVTHGYTQNQPENAPEIEDDSNHETEDLPDFFANSGLDG